MIDRFSDFLHLAGRPGRPHRDDLPQVLPPLRPPWQRYALRLAAWRCGSESIDLAARLAAL